MEKKLEGNSSSKNDEEFQEEDILWGTSSTTLQDDQRKEATFISKARKLMIPKFNKRSQEMITQPHSAPVKIPADWSKIRGKTISRKNSRNAVHSWEDEDDQDEDEDEEGRNVMIPPHEWIAAKQPSSFSVCEGAGRRLKGRDLRLVRTAVLTKTGFLESPESGDR